MYDSKSRSIKSVIPSFKMEGNLEIQRIKNLIETTMAQRGRFYGHSYAFPIHFENDDTNASQDTIHFKDMMKIMGFSKGRRNSHGKN